MEVAVDPSAGFVISVKPGDTVEENEPLATVFARDRATVDAGLAALRNAIVIADEAAHPQKLISHRVSGFGVELL